ncbi:rhodanese-like domain-containing protein [Marivivens sp. LCG002]|uniref:rhodanese-like domain-containing protein n=1 Tax=Marivivens sp. LCG002 TaxID=3051171 RepID=UPI002554FC10|nr:rhodanese-like domain-containing protein [Marivivens sp. LCG002]WIV50951.1 rhodanese-like domain-containing protein [Marivivens sp. LCG002]
MMVRIGALIAAVVTFAFATGTSAQTVKITEDKASVSFVLNGQSYTIERNQDENATLEAEFTKTSRSCPPFCVQPISIAEGVETYGELEILGFLENEVAGGTGLLVDARLPEFYVKGTIPGALNIPFSALSADNPYLTDILKALGAKDAGGSLDFSSALQLALFCNGPWCGQSPRAITELLDAGYPAERIKYYRGGMQDWLGLGLSTIIPNQ